MAKTLHITNGDSFTTVLNELNISGDIITWREMLCEGKTINEVGSESFWRQRYEFLNRAYKITKDTFINRTLKEYRNLCNQKSQEEIVLWFEYDLFCQVNMIAVLSWLKKNRSDADIFLACSGKEDATDKLYALTELSKEKLEKLYENRVLLTKDDIEYGDYIWQLYCENNPIRLQNAIKQNTSELTYLSKAMESHIHRFPSLKNGLNELENKMLEKSLNKQLKSKDDIIQEMLLDQGIYGFGDIQFVKMANNLRPLFKSFNPVKLTKTGAKVAEKLENYYPNIRSDKEYLGGTPKYSFLFMEDSEQLLKL
ncbi:hypothetical protein JoomaDRAFT_3573 [Galbibacter orientalis DSM 19592]|uniref:DUF1835 domain-containing protein n=1 Tax=Galbibacter orientalis DSM 19592 TaxID=926559 RepID=I3CA68_9FLAO|nr:DUF1835 domain-containing protein [Galbibacter orientalis]EIJ40511.1 hypothetical protein JoomaDRAFT_3573 [Galbibacter orientalis DSM 19592]